MPLKIFKQKNKSLPSDQQQSQFQEHHNHFGRLQQDSPLLRKRPLTPIAPLERDEVHTIPGDKGMALGGGFYNACAVSRICLRERRPQQDLQSERQALADRSAQEEKGYYSIKFLSKKTIKRLQAADKQLLVQSMTNLLVEANYLTKFQHPHILTAQGMATTTASTATATTDAGCFVITERLADTLEERLEKWQAEHSKNPSAHAVDPKCPTFAIKLEYALQIAQALEYLHERQILVLGLQPSSIGFLAQSGRLQLCDLGTCREVSAFKAGGKGSPLGGGIEDDDLKFDDDEIGDGERFVQGAVVTEDETDALLIPMLETGVVPRYLAPEIVTSQKSESASAQADVYSWAMIVVEMITLQKPFSHYRKGEYLIKVCVEGKRPNLAIFPNLPQAMESVLRRCWRHAQEKRWNSTQVVEAMQKIIEKHVHVGGNNNTSRSISRKHKDTNGQDTSKEMVPLPAQPRLSRSTSVPSVPTTGRRISSGVPTDIGIVMDQSLMRNSIVSHSSSRRRSSQGFAPLFGMGDGSLMQQSLMGQSSNTKNSERQGSISSQRRRSRRSSKAGEDKPVSMRNLLAGPAVPRSPPSRLNVARSQSDCHQLGKMAQTTAEKKRHSDVAPKKQKTLRRTKSDDKEGVTREPPRRTKSSDGVIGGILAAAGFGDSSAYAAVPSRSKSPRRGRRSDSKKAPKKLDANWDNAVGNASMESSHHSQVSFSLENTSNHETAIKSRSPSRPKSIGVRSISLGEAPQLEDGWDAFANRSAQWSSSDMGVSLQKGSSHSKKERSKSPRRPKSGDSKTKARETDDWNTFGTYSPKGSNSQRGVSLQSNNSNHKKDRSTSPRRSKIGDGRSKSVDNFDAFGGGSLQGSNSQMGVSSDKGSNHQTIELSSRSSTHEKKTTKRSSKGRKRGSSVGNAAMLPSNGQPLGNSNHDNDVGEPGMELASPPSSLEKKPLKRRSSNKGIRKRESHGRSSDRQSEDGAMAQDERRRSSKSSNTDYTSEDASKRTPKSSKGVRKTTSGDLSRKKKLPQQRNKEDVVNLEMAVAESDAAARTAAESTAALAESSSSGSNQYARSDTLDKKEPRRRSIAIDMDASAKDTKVGSEPHIHTSMKPPRRTMSAANMGDRRPAARNSVPNRKLKETLTDPERPSMSRSMSFRPRREKVDHAAGTRRRAKEV